MYIYMYIHIHIYIRKYTQIICTYKMIERARSVHRSAQKSKNHRIATEPGGFTESMGASLKHRDSWRTDALSSPKRPQKDTKRAMASK